MGILNVTPDSFSDGGVFFDRDRAVARAVAMVDEGVDIIDVGGESTRPGARPVSAEEEIGRVVPVIAAIKDAVDVPISIDTSKPGVMRAACAAGAGFINDVRALCEPDALDTAATLGVPVCLMHMRGEPGAMQDAPQYDNVVIEVREFLVARRAAAIAAGIKPEVIVLDPGFGFGKTAAHNLELLRNLRVLGELGAPLLVGMSRKSMIGALTRLPVEQRLHASIALAVMAVCNGAAIVRVHDVRATVEALRMVSAVYPPE